MSIYPLCLTHYNFKDNSTSHIFFSDTVILQPQITVTIYVNGMVIHFGTPTKVKNENVYKKDNGKKRDRPFIR